MSRQRAPYAKRSVWYVVLILAVVVVVGFAGAGYELNHLRTEINGQNVRINALSRRGLDAQCRGRLAPLFPPAPGGTVQIERLALGADSASEKVLVRPGL